MGGRPVSALLSVAVPDTSAAWLQEFMVGFLEMLQEHDGAAADGSVILKVLTIDFDVSAVVWLNRPGNDLDEG